MWIQAFLALGWKTCASVLDENSSNAEIEGCVIMVESTKKLVDKCLSESHGALGWWNALHASLSSPSPTPLHGLVGVLWLGYALPLW